jgi:hypothetical protein
MTGALPHTVDGTTRALRQGGAVAEFARASLQAATHHVFVTLTATTLLLTVAAACVPRRAAGL